MLPMNIALSHRSAQEAYYLDMAGLHSRLVGRGGIEKVLLPCDFDPSLAPEEAAYLESLGITLPLETLASRHHRWRSSSFFTSHSTEPGSPCSVTLPVLEGLSTSSPEYLFLQMAGELDHAALVLLGFELCGRYSCDPLSLRETQYNRESLTSTQQLQQFLSMATGRHGVKPARAALRFIRDNSRSPMESYLAMRLGLPYHRGGFNLGMPEMNPRIELDETAKLISGKNYLECDLYYPQARLAIEYESTAFHGNVSATKNRQDSARRAALEHLGIKVLTLTDVQSLNERDLSLFAAHVAKLLGKRLRPTCEGYPDRKYKLRISLLGGSRSNPRQPAR